MGNIIIKNGPYFTTYSRNELIEVENVEVKNGCEVSFEALKNEVLEALKNIAPTDDGIISAGEHKFELSKKTDHFSIDVECTIFTSIQDGELIFDDIDVSIFNLWNQDTELIPYKKLLGLTDNEIDKEIFKSFRGY